MRIEFVFDSYEIGLWFRRRWHRTLIRLHLRKPLEHSVTQRYGAVNLSQYLYDFSPTDVPLPNIRITGEVGLAGKDWKASVTDLSDEDG